MKFFKRKKYIFLCIILLIATARHFYFRSRSFYEVAHNKEDISSIIKKEKLTDKDYEVIFRQTGITKLASEELIQKKDFDFLEKMNDLYFEKPEFKTDYIAFPITAAERNTQRTTPLAPLKTGDILVTFNTATLDWRHGHAALVLDGDKKKLLEHMSVGETSCITNALLWGTYPSFAVLRYPDAKTARSAAAYAMEHLIYIDYNILAGVIKKDKSDEKKPSSSHCSHIVWQAYKSQGVDIDNNGGIFVTPKDIFNSDKLEIVQIYGMDLEK